MKYIKRVRPAHEQKKKIYKGDQDKWTTGTKLHTNTVIDKHHFNSIDQIEGWACPRYRNKTILFVLLAILGSKMKNITIYQVGKLCFSQIPRYHSEKNN